MSLQHSSSEILSQLVRLIDQLDEKQYACALTSFEGSTIGQHVRHVVEFYDCLFRGMQTGTVNYDKRSRNSVIETDVHFTIQLLHDIIHKINNLKFDKSLRLIIDLSHNSEETEIHTTYFRELAYNIEHAIHHMAIIKMGVMAHFAHVRFEENFGVAYSTQQHLEKEKVLSK